MKFDFWDAEFTFILIIIKQIGIHQLHNEKFQLNSSSPASSDPNKSANQKMIRAKPLEKTPLGPICEWEIETQTRLG